MAARPIAASLDAKAGLGGDSVPPIDRVPLSPRANRRAALAAAMSGAPPAKAQILAGQHVHGTQGNWSYQTASQHVHQPDWKDPNVIPKKRRIAPWDAKDTLPERADRSASATVGLAPPKPERQLSSGSFTILQKVALSDEQRHILDLCVRKRENVFFTGSAGWYISLVIEPSLIWNRDWEICPPQGKCVR